ncbi:hypothetical protein DYB38_012793 [Aphanomyces astaci]|uniref:Uncharacterized protein n=2 Tax=Aphanomyces astaci TaxID=112090 RepID=A0A397FUX8_APHAT|nr:hypothetical protein DYB34_002530 [Aphanomyces astaci]RHY58574.1 hypothetical protein DYB38_012793 [Aphanomyces astaci]RHZ41001.1 hypothetical protein DYB31_005550 [Aphanomyces astaci]
MGAGRRDLTSEEREAILREILLKSVGSFMPRLAKGFGEDLAAKYNCNVRTIRRIHAQAKANGALTGVMKVNVASKKKGRMLSAVDSSEMERTVSLELKEARLMDELSRMLEGIVLSDGSAESSADGIISEFGIEVIELNDE